MRDGDFRQSYKEATLDYEARLIEYQAALVDYRRAMERWNSLPVHERERLNREAETDSRALWSALASVAATFIAYAYLKSLIHGSMFWWAWGSASAFAWLVILGLRGFLGPLFRALFFGGAGLIIGFFALWILNANGSGSSLGVYANGAIFIGPVIIGFIFGLLYRASAAPRRPARPKAPNRRFYQ